MTFYRTHKGGSSRVQLAKMTSVYLLVWFCKKLRFSVQFQFYKISCGNSFFPVQIFTFICQTVNVIFHLCLYGMVPEMMYFCAKVKKNTLTVEMKCE